MFEKFEDYGMGFLDGICHEGRMRSERIRETGFAGVKGVEGKL